MKAQKILVVEDDPELARWLSDYLAGKGYDVSSTEFGKEAIRRVQSDPPDALILDGILPDVDGLDVCRHLRPGYQGVIVMLTARDEEVDEVLGLEIGADDYLVKPVRARALLTRIQGHLKRREGAAAGPIELPGLSIRPGSREIKARGLPVELTSAEFELLCVLARQAGSIVTRQNLITTLRGLDYDGSDRSIDLRVSRIRKKLGDDPQSPRLIKTVRGRGYLLSADGIAQL